MCSITTLLILLVAGVLSGRAQAGARYQPAQDTLRYESLNSYFMYFVRGADTLGEPVTTRTLELRRLQPAESGLELWVRLEGTGPDPFRSEETYTITPSGRVLAVGGQPVAAVANARVDVLPRLPASGRLQQGVQWNDTVSIRRTEPYGTTYYDVQRTYRVVRIADSASTRIAILVADGQMKLRQGGWQDSTQGVVWWQEVAGPTADTVWLDTRAGRILASVTIMNLAGSGGFGPRGGGITMPSGLRSSVRITNRP